MQVLVVSGFLGAGKTTFIKELIRRTGKFLVVLENEYGDNNLDSQALSGTGEIEILEFMEGCVCCTKKDTFLNSILSISAALDPEYLVVEPTGVGKLGNILENVQTVTYDRIRLLPPVVILAPQSFYEFKREYPDIYVNQIENAGIVVFSKCENADPDFLEQISNEIREIRPDIEIVSEHYSHRDDAWFNALLDGNDMASKAVTSPTIKESTDDPLDEISVKDMTFSSPGGLLAFLNSILAGRYGNIVRSKGVVKCGEEYLRFDFADNMYAVKGETEAPTLQAVFIGRNLIGDEIRKAGGVTLQPEEEKNPLENLEIGEMVLPGKRK